MFLSHILSGICFAAVLVLGVMLSQLHTPSFVFEVGGLALIVAAYKLSKVEWIWIGPTLPQAKEKLDLVIARLRVLDKAVFPPSNSLDFVPQNASQIHAQRRKLIRQRDKLERLIRSQERSGQGRVQG